MRIKRAVQIAVVTGTLVAGGAVPALATIKEIGGGTWDYGAGTSYVWSDYYHKSKCHGSTSVGSFIDSDEASAGDWSLTQADAALSGNETYYKTTC
ncbi:lactococcin 972 family bacteriocin [Streptomyces sp. NPDC048590]|uniref:lactococcin 972 family bacteriocin n=1 Tax=Streptomyces sp. NPDC048590 TaxID=3365574 RepID=UPI0037171466